MAVYNHGTRTFCSAFTPRHLAGLVLWLRADLHVELDGVSGKVYRWLHTPAPVGGPYCLNGNTVTQPPLVTGGSGIGGQPALSFDTSTYISLYNLSVASASDYLVFAVVSPNNLTGNQAIFSTSAGPLDLYSAEATNLGGNAGWYDGTYHGNAAMSASAVALCWDLRSTASGVLYQNGQALSSTLPYAASTIGGSIMIGGLASGGNNFDGKLAELVIVSRPNDAARAKLYRYAKRRYGMSGIVV